MPGSEASHASSLTQVIANLGASNSSRKYERRSSVRSIAKSSQRINHATDIGKMAGNDHEEPFGESDEVSRLLEQSGSSMPRQSKPRNNLYLGEEYTNMMGSYQLLSIAQKLNSHLDEVTNRKLATHAETHDSSSDEDDVGSTDDGADQRKCSAGESSEVNRRDGGEQEMRTKVDGSSDSSPIDGEQYNNKNRSNVKDSRVYIVGNGSYDVTASSFGAASLMDADDVSVHMTDSDSIDSFVHEGQLKNPSSTGDAKMRNIFCTTPPPSSAESTSNSSSSSNESAIESCKELLKRHDNSNAIFRGRSYSNFSASRGRLASQDSGVNSLLSRSGALSMSSEQLDGEKGNGLYVTFTPLKRIPYVHGSFSTAAPMMLHDTKWMRILRLLMPESHADAVTMLCQELKSSSVEIPNAVRLMKWAENNPVVAAYGIMTSDARKGGSKREKRQSSANDCTSARASLPVGAGRPPPSPLRRAGSPKTQATARRKPMLEWDVFLDPNLVRKVDAALRDADETRRVRRSDEIAQIAAEVEVDRQVGRLISRMVLAHGSTSQLVAEAVGFSPLHNFASVVEQGEAQRLHRRRRKLKRDESLSRSGLINAWKADRAALARRADNHIVPLAPGKGSAKGAGIFVERWMAIFATALRLAEENGRIDDSESLSDYGKLLDNLEQDVEIRQVKPPMCGMFLCLGYEDPNSKKADHSKTAMATSAKEVLQVLGSPLSVVLDLKSRRVPPRVWARLVDTLRSRGLEVGGLGSFDVDELRAIGSFCTAPVTGVIFFHSAGDLQRACHAKEVKRGDTVYFNAGSLIMPKPNIIAKINCCKSEQYLPEKVVTDKEVVFQPYAFPRHKIPESLQALDCKSTLQDYQRWFDLKIGVYVQEFSISDYTLDAISRLVNANPTIYNLGLAWGGLNGKTSPGVPGDGYWNQRYMGRTWDMNAEPTDSMDILHIEDHHLVKKAFRAGAWGPIGMVNPVNDVGGDATGDGASLNFEPCRPME